MGQEDIWYEGRLGFGDESSDILDMMVDLLDVKHARYITDATLCNSQGGWVSTSCCHGLEQ